MTWLDTLTEKALARALPTRAEVLKFQRVCLVASGRGPGTELPANA
jgi:hypothetical protein